MQLQVWFLEMTNISVFRNLLLLFSHSVMSDSATPWTAAYQTALFFTISRSLLKLMSIESVMPSNHLILWLPLLLLPSIFPSIRVFSNDSVLHIRKIWSIAALASDQSWVYIGRTVAKAETPILWPPHAKSWLIGKDSDAGRDWGQEEKGMTEDEMAGWYHRLHGCESEWTPGDGDGQGGLTCRDSWGRKESDTTEWLDWTE